MSHPWTLYLSKMNPGYCKNMQTYSVHFGNVCLHTLNMKVSTSRSLWCSSASQKETSSFTYFLRYYILNNLAIWLAESIWPITGDPEFCPIWDWWWNIKNNNSFHFRSFPRKTNDKIFDKIIKTLFWDHFGSFLPKFEQN